jgi:hypothetical protein
MVQFKIEFSFDKQNWHGEVFIDTSVPGHLDHDPKIHFYAGDIDDHFFVNVLLPFVRFGVRASGSLTTPPTIVSFMVGTLL